MRAQAFTCDSLGFIHHHLGRHQQALAAYRRALELLREVGDRDQESHTLVRMGETYEAIGEHEAARQAWTAAAAILDDLAPLDAVHVRARLLAAR